MAGQVSIKEAARRLGVTPKEIRRRIKNGELAGFVQLPGMSEAQDLNAKVVRSDNGTDGVVAEPGRGGTASTSIPTTTGGGALETRPDARDVEIQRLQALVTVLRDELEARRREVQELHVLLREQQRTMLTAALNPALPRPAVDTASPSTSSRIDESPDAAEKLPQIGRETTGNGDQLVHAEGAEAEGDRDVLIDWQAYDAESEHLRHTMGRLQELLEELERVTPEETTQLDQARETTDHNVTAMTPSHDASPSPADALAEVPPPIEATQSEASLVETPPAAAAPTTPADEPPTGPDLARRREAMGLSREVVAASTGLSWGFVTEVERGRRKDARSRQRLADALTALKGTTEKP